MPRASRAIGLALFAAVTLATMPASAQTYPNGPVRLIVPTPAGGVTDTMARIVAQRLGEQLNQTVIVDNRPGGNGGVGAQAVERSPADGLTLMVTSDATITANPFLSDKLSYNASAFTPIIVLCRGTPVLVVNSSVPANSTQELIALAKAKPDQLFFGSVGVGSPPHLAGELFKVMAGVKLVHVPYAGGSGQAATDLIAGRISMVFSPASTIAPHITAGSVKALAAATAKRAGLFPDLPTIAEAGLPGFDSGIWGGLMAPAGTPRAVIDRLARAVNDALKTPEVQSVLRNAGIDPLGGTPEDFAELIQREMEKWAKVAKIAGLSK